MLFRDGNETNGSRVGPEIVHCRSFHCRAGKKVQRAVPDPLVQEIRGIVGKKWAENDRAIAAAYATDPSPLAAGTILPKLVIMPADKEEISAVVRALSRANLPWGPGVRHQSCGAHTHERRPYRPRQNEENSFWRTVMVCHN